MNKRKLLSVLTLLFAFVTLTMAQQPFAGCWHLDYIKDWSPETDPDAKFNRSTVSLQPRFYDDGIKANPNQHYTGKVAACLTMNTMASQTPAQGANNFIGYNPNEWQYMDLVVWWGGSAGEGVVIPPSAPVTDIAHLNGVKMLGNVFFAPGAFGGQAAWVYQMLTKEGDTYPYAKKLYEIAKYYGFDGWFINEETVGGNKDKWTEFIKYYLDLAIADGDTNMEIQWYDMGTQISGVADIIKISPRTSFFANYGSASSGTISSNMAALASYGFTPEQSFLKLYSGIECAQGGLYGNKSGFDACFPAAGHESSIQMFNPEEHIWKKVVQSLLGTPNAEGPQAYAAMNTVFNNSAGFFVNAANDPSNAAGRLGGSWPGLANGIQERSTIQQKPFVTSFSAGLGKHRFVNGEKRGTQDWYHRGMQDILPTWRWWVDATNGGAKSDLKFEFNWDDAYNMGTSLVVKGKLNAGADYFTRLYKTKLPVAAGDKFQLVYKTANDGTMQLKVITTDNVTTSFNLTQNTTSNGWSVANVDLSSLAGKTISVIAINFNSASAIDTYEVRLGQMAVMAGSYAPAATQAANVRSQNELKEEISDIRLIWDAPANTTDIHHYNVYFTRGTAKVLAGQTRNEGFYIPKFTRTAGEQSVAVSVSAVTKDMKEGSEVALTLNYPEMGLPVVSLKASPTLVKVDEEVTVTAIANNAPETYTWTVPENAVLVSQTENKAVFKFSQEGLFTIKVSVANAVGTTEYQIEKFIEVNNEKVIDNLAKGKKIHSVSGFIDPERPEYLVDGIPVPNSVRNKWCVGGQYSHWVIIDLQASYKLYKFVVYDCGHKENASDNFKNYKVEVSNDLQTWTEVVNEKNIPATAAYNTKTAWIKPTTGRYIRFTPYDEEMPITIRIWEFQAFGAESNLLLEKKETQRVNINTTTPISMTYGLGGDEKQPNFNISVTSSDQKMVEIQNVTITESTVNFDVVAKEYESKATILVKMTNGEDIKMSEFDVVVQDPNNLNVLIGVVSTVTDSGNVEGQDDPGGNTNPAAISDDNLETVWSSGWNQNATVHYSFVFELDGIYLLNKFVGIFSSNQYTFVRQPMSFKVYASSTTNTDDAYTLVGENYNRQFNYEIGLNEPTEAKYVKFVVNTENWYGYTIKELQAWGKKKDETGIFKTNATTFSIYPNPVKAGETIRLNVEQGATVRVMTLQGVTVASQAAASTEASINTSNFGAGTYIVSVQKDGALRTAKLIVK